MTQTPASPRQRSCKGAPGRIRHREILQLPLSTEFDAIWSCHVLRAIKATGLDNVQSDSPCLTRSIEQTPLKNDAFAEPRLSITSHVEASDMPSCILITTPTSCPFIYIHQLLALHIPHYSYWIPYSQIPQTIRNPGAPNKTSKARLRHRNVSQHQPHPLRPPHPQR